MIKSVKNPFEYISMMIGIAIMVALIVILFPLILTDLVSMGGIGNFTFASLFSSTGLMAVILSAVVLIGLLSFFGIKVGSGKGR